MQLTVQGNAGYTGQVTYNQATYGQPTYIQQQASYGQTGYGQAATQQAAQHTSHQTVALAGQKRDATYVYQQQGYDYSQLQDPEHAADYSNKRSRY